MDVEPRVPPQAIQSEQAVLGGLLLDPSAWPKVSDLLTEQDFYRSEHRLIFRAIRALAERGRAFDVLTVGDFLRGKGHGEDIHDGTYLFDLAASIPGTANITSYAETVAGKARLRRAIETGTALVNNCFAPGDRDADEVIADAAQALAELQPTATTGARSMRENLRDWIDEHETRLAADSWLTGLPTPWQGLNRVTHGLQPATVYVIAARPSMGKSTFALNLALFAALRNEETALFSLEMSAVDCQRRFVSSTGGIPFDWICAPTKADEEIYTERVASVIQQLAKATLRIDDTPSLTVRQFEARALRMHQQKPIKLLIVDHMHDFRIDAKQARFEYGEIVQAGKRLAKRLNIPVVLLAQLNRNVAGRTDKRPTLTDLRESGEIEQKADVIAFLHREDYYDTPEHQTHLQGVVELHIAKGRNVRAGERINLRNRMDQARLDEWEGPLPAAPEKPSKRKAVGFSGASNTRADVYQ